MEEEGGGEPQGHQERGGSSGSDDNAQPEGELGLGEASAFMEVRHRRSSSSSLPNESAWEAGEEGFTGWDAQDHEASSQGGAVGSTDGLHPDGVEVSLEGPELDGSSVLLSDDAGPVGLEGYLDPGTQGNGGSGGSTAEASSRRPVKQSLLAHLAARQGSQGEGGLPIQERGLHPPSRSGPPTISQGALEGQDVRAGQGQDKLALLSEQLRLKDQLLAGMARQSQQETDRLKEELAEAEREIVRLKRDKDLLVGRIMKQERELEQLHMDKVVLAQRLERLEGGGGGGTGRGGAAQEPGDAGGNMARAVPRPYSRSGEAGRGREDRLQALESTFAALQAEVEGLRQQRMVDAASEELDPGSYPHGLRPVGEHQDEYAVYRSWQRPLSARSRSRSPRSPRSPRPPSEARIAFVHSDSLGQSWSESGRAASVQAKGPPTPNMRPSPKPFYPRQSPTTSPPPLFGSPRASAPASIGLLSSPAPNAPVLQGYSEATPGSVSVSRSMSMAGGTITFASPNEAKKWNAYCSDGFKQALFRPPSPPAPASSKERDEPHPAPTAAPQQAYASPATTYHPAPVHHEPELTAEPPQHPRSLADIDEDNEHQYHYQQQQGGYMTPHAERGPQSLNHQQHQERLEALVEDDYHDSYPSPRQMEREDFEPPPPAVRDRAQSQPKVMSLAELTGLTGASASDVRAAVQASPPPARTKGAGEPVQYGQGAAPFATESTIRQMGDWVAMEHDLMALNWEKTQLESELSKLQPKASRTMRDRTRVATLESRLQDVRKRISRLKIDLKGAPS